MTIQNQAELISIGTELLIGETMDTNAKFLATELRLIGIEVGRATTAGDDKDQLSTVFRDALERTDLVLASGGLGPTDDDLTRDCLAEVLGETMFVDAGLMQALRDYFKNFGRGRMPGHNVRQAMLIPSAKAIPNQNGTAPGWWVEKNDKTIVLIPGPPREMEPMWRDEVRPRLLAKFPGRVALTRTLKVFGMSEATVNEMATPFFHKENPSLGIYAKPDGIHLRLIARGEDALQRIEDTEKQIKTIFKKRIWGTDNETLPEIVVGLLKDSGRTAAIFDAGTGGIAGNMLYAIDGLSGCYRGSLVAGAGYIEAISQPLAETIGKHGAIGAAAAEGMAAYAREFFGVKVGIGISGITGMDEAGDTDGIAFVAITDDQGKANWRQSIVPRRDITRSRLAMAAMFRLRERLIMKQS